MFLERALPIAILATALFSVPLILFSSTGLSRLSSLRAERESAREEVSRIEEEIRQLRAAVERIKSDPAAVERVARDELGLVRQTEVVFQFAE